MKCGQQQSSNTQIISATQKINGHGRKEIELTATQENYVTFGDDHKYHCVKCGASFTLTCCKEALEFYSREELQLNIILLYIDSIYQCYASNIHG